MKNIEFCFISYRSRNHSLEFYKILTKNGISANIIDTPKQASIGCGLSVQFKCSQLDKVMYLETKHRFTSFIGFFKLKNINNQIYVTPL